MSVTKTPASLDDLRRVWIGRTVHSTTAPAEDRGPGRLVESIDFRAEDGNYHAVSVGAAGTEQVVADSPIELHRRLCQLAAPSS